MENSSNEETVEESVNLTNFIKSETESDCDICGKNFKNSSSLEKHIIEVSKYNNENEVFFKVCLLPLVLGIYNFCQEPKNPILKVPFREKLQIYRSYKVL